MKLFNRLNNSGGEKLTILRVEDKRGRGLYQSLWQEAIVDVFKNFNEDEFNLSFPEPISDEDFVGKIRIVENKRGKYFAMPSYYSGFKDKKQYLNWVSKREWRESLAKLGGVLSTYSVPEKYIIFAQKQILFRKGKAKRTRVESLLFFD